MSFYLEKSIEFCIKVCVFFFPQILVRPPFFFPPQDRLQAFFRRCSRRVCFFFFQARSVPQPNILITLVGSDMDMDTSVCVVFIQLYPPVAITATCLSTLYATLHVPLYFLVTICFVNLVNIISTVI